MRRAQRLRGRRDFARVYRRGRPLRNELLMLRAVRSEAVAQTRFGFAVSRAVGKAVVRNRVKRRLREAARSLPVEAGWDVVVNARPAAAERDYWELRSALARLLERACLLETTSEREQ